MRLKIFIYMLLSVVYSASAQIGLDDVPGAIEISKAASLPIWCGDSLAPRKNGTGFVFGEKKNIIVITCEHVLADKNALGKTIKYYPIIFVYFNGIDSIAIPVKSKILYADEINDFAILGPIDNDSINMVSLLSKVKFKMITPSQTLLMENLQEGEPVIYSGYPMSLGMGEKNHPISRLGMIAQCIKGEPFFLIDGFVQHGHSGSPVFVIRDKKIVDKKKGKIRIRLLVGITRGFPNELTEIIQKTAFIIDSTRQVVTNPGFTVVTPMNEIMRVIKKLAIY